MACQWYYIDIIIVILRWTFQYNSNMIYWLSKYGVWVTMIWYNSPIIVIGYIDCLDSVFIDGLTKYKNSIANSLAMTYAPY